jgi:hypothetical protein
MSLWGNKDLVTGSGDGTVTVTVANTTVIAASGADLTDFAVGDYLNAGGHSYVITAIANSTVGTVRSANAALTMSGASANGDYEVSEKPLFVTFSESMDSVTVGGTAENVYGASVAETTAANNITHAGWVRRTVGTGGRAGRVFFETLVASSSITSDANDDTKLPDYKIVIGTQPSDASAVGGVSNTFTVAASTLPTGGTLGYLWQYSTDSGANWSNTKVASNTNVTLTLASGDTEYANTNIFRVQVSVSGGHTVTSDSATLTVIA